MRWALRCLGLLMLGGASGESCGPTFDDTAPDDTGGVTVDAGTITDNDVSLDWRLYGSWGDGACLDMKFTNLGDRVTAWQFEMGLDQVVSEVAYGGSFPSAFTVILDEARLVPFAEPLLAPFGSVSYAVCLEPVVRPVAFTANVQRDESGGGSAEVPEADVYGSVLDDSGQLVLIWLDKDADPDAFCLELRLGNLTVDRVEDWSVRVRFDQPYNLRSTDTTFYYFQTGLDQLDILPTNQTRVFDPLDVHVGSICMDAVALPESFQATFITEDATSAPAAVRPPGVAVPAQRRGGLMVAP